MESHIDFLCNCCGNWCVTPQEKVQRENASCFKCGSSVRMRSIVHHVSMGMFQKPVTLPEFPIAKHIRGLGMSDWEGYAQGFGLSFDYINTFFHQSPMLDVTQPVPAEYLDTFNFIVSSEVLEHVYPPVQRAIDNIYSMLAPNGLLILTVPYNHNNVTEEHYPGALRGAAVQLGADWVYVYRDENGYHATPNVIFHGGPGSTVEMRHFGFDPLMAHLRQSGFVEIRAHSADYPPYGIINRHPFGLTITAWRDTRPRVSR